jgi:hypothetical protein
MRLNDQQFLAIVGVIIVASIAYLTYERFLECQDLGGSHCYLGRRIAAGSRLGLRRSLRADASF